MRNMSEGFWIAVLIVVAVAAYVLSKVFYYVRRSAEQWKQVDKTKLREWEDDDEW